jgi:hypothetical protein
VWRLFLGWNSEPDMIGIDSFFHRNTPRRQWSKNHYPQL